MLFVLRFKMRILIVGIFLIFTMLEGLTTSHGRLRMQKELPLRNRKLWIVKR